MAFNTEFHAMMRETLGARTVAGKGVMQQKGDAWYIMCPEKGVTRMEWCVAGEARAQAAYVHVLALCRPPRVAASPACLPPCLQAGSLPVLLRPAASA